MNKEYAEWREKFLWSSPDDLTAGWKCQCGFQFKTTANETDFERHYEECEENNVYSRSD